MLMSNRDDLQKKVKKIKKNKIEKKEGKYSLEIFDIRQRTLILWYSSMLKLISAVDCTTLMDHENICSIYIWHCRINLFKQIN